MTSAVEPLLDAIHLDRSRPHLAEKDGVAVRALALVTENDGIGKDAEEGGHLAFYHFGRGFVERHPLRQHPARIEVLLHQFEIVPSVQRGRSLNPWVNGVGSDNVEFFSRR